MFDFNETFSSKSFKYWFENNPAVNNKTPHIVSQFFGNEDTDEKNVTFLVDNLQIDPLISLGAVDQPTPLRGFKGTNIKNMNFPYFNEGCHSTQEETNELAYIMRNAENGKPSDKALLRLVLKLYERVAGIIQGGVDTVAYMEMSMLQDGHFLLRNNDNYTGKLIDLYNYDSDGSWQRDHIVTLTGSDVWSDTTNSDPIEQIIDIAKTIRLQGGELTAIMADSKTLEYLYKNKKLINYLPLIGVINPNYKVGEAEVRAIIKSRTNIELKIIANDEIFVGWDNKKHTYMDTNKVVFIGASTLGTAWNGKTYEENYNLIKGGNAYKSQERLANGTVVSQYMKPDPDEDVFRVTRAVIPSFEGMNLVYCYQWIDSETQFTITYDENGGAGTAPRPQGVLKGESMQKIGMGNTLVKNGKRFMKWNTNANGTGTDITVGFVPTDNTTVYAIYES